MKTLYDVLGIRPDDDPEEFKRAFRKAAKASHPDFHANDPDAPIRFRQVVKAYTILSDPEQRAAYDELLELERQQLRETSTRYTVRRFIVDGIAAASLAVILAGGYTLFVAGISPSMVAAKLAAPWRGPGEVAVVRPAASTETTDQSEPRREHIRDQLAVVEIPNTATVLSELAPAEVAPASAVNGANALANDYGRPAQIAAVHPAALTDTTDQGGPRDQLADAEPLNTATAPSEVAPVEIAVASVPDGGDALANADGEPALSAVKPDLPEIPVANIMGAFGMGAFGATAATDQLKNYSAIGLPTQKPGRPVGVPSSLERNDGAARSPAPGFAKPGEKGGMKPRDKKTAERPPAVAKRPAANPAPPKRVSLENKGTPASRDVTPLFGVGF